MKVPEQVTTLKIDDREVSAKADQTILDVACENGIEIPTLCFLEGLLEVGACRLCPVEINGTSTLQPACVTRVREGMEATTHSPRLTRIADIFEPIFTEGITFALCASRTATANYRTWRRLWGSIMCIIRI